MTEQRTSGGVIVRRNEDGSLDEVVGVGITAHLEQLSEYSWHLSIGDVIVSLWVNAEPWEKSELRATVIEPAPVSDG